MGREHGGEFFVAGQLVREVGDVRFFGADSFEEIQRLLEGRMGVVVADLDAAQGHVIYAFQLFEFRFAVQHLDIGEVGDVAETVAQHGEFLLAVVPALDGDDFRRGVRRGLRRQVVVAEAPLPAQDFLSCIGVDQERMGAVDGVQVPFRSTGVFVLREGVGVFAAERILHIRLAVDIDRVALAQVEGTDVVQSGRMVLVVVREQDGVQVIHPGAQHLVAEVRSGVHQDGQAAVFHQRGGAQPLVARVGRAADLAVAADHRDAGGSTRAEEGQSCFLLHS